MISSHSTVKGHTFIKSKDLRTWASLQDTKLIRILRPTNYWYFTMTCVFDTYTEEYVWRKVYAILIRMVTMETVYVNPPDAFDVTGPG